MDCCVLGWKQRLLRLNWRRCWNAVSVTHTAGIILRPDQILKTFVSLSRCRRSVSQTSMFSVRCSAFILRLAFNVKGDTLTICDSGGTVIQGYKCRDTERLKRTGESRRFKAVERVALRKLDMLDAAVSLNALRVPPGNQLEALQGDRKGQHSIRINQQWRVCFSWREGHAYDVEIVDYH